MKKFQNNCSRFETHSLTVSKFQNAQKKKGFAKNTKTPKVQNDFYSFPSRFHYENENFSFSPIFRFQNLIVFKVKIHFYSFSSRFQYENEKICVFTKILFSKSHQFQMFQKDFFRFPAFFSMKRKMFRFHQNFVFKCFKTIFSVFQPFYEIPKRLEKQFCSCFKIQNAYQKA